MEKKTSLVIFTCEGREHLLTRTIASFRKDQDFRFSETILAIDGQVDPAIISLIAPDIVIQHYKRKGYVQSIARTLKLIKTPFFFWLEDDWTFERPVNLPAALKYLSENSGWSQIILSKYGPLSPALKVHPVGNNFYKTPFGFSANPCICKTSKLIAAFENLEMGKKGNEPGKDGFENYLTGFFEERNIHSIIIDPEDHYPISHEGYLETTPRTWHMTVSLDQRSKVHLLTIPRPSGWRRMIMALKLTGTFCYLIFQQFRSNAIYEYCFRVVTGSKMIKRDE